MDDHHRATLLWLIGALHALLALAISAPEPANVAGEPAPALSGAPPMQMTGVPTCDPTGTLETRMADFLGEQWAAGLRPETGIQISIERGTATRYVANVSATIEGRVLVRRLQSMECEVLIAATALVVAVAIEPVVVANRIEAQIQTPRTKSPHKAAVPERAPKARPKANQATSPVPPLPRPEPTAGHWLGVWGGTSGGVLPEWGATLALRYMATWQHVGLGAQVGYETPRTKLYLDEERGASFQSVSLGATACPGWYRSWGHVGMCGGMRAAIIPVRPVAVLTPHAQVLTWAGASGGIDAAWSPIPRLKIGGSLEGLTSFLRPAVHIVPRPPLYRIQRFAWRAMLGVAAVAMIRQDIPRLPHTDRSLHRSRV